MAAVLACGPGAVLSHRSAGELWVICPPTAAEIELSRVGVQPAQRSGIRVHRRIRLDPEDQAIRSGIPLTSPIRTLVDLACLIDAKPLERAVNEADRLEFVGPDLLREAAEVLP